MRTRGGVSGIELPDLAGERVVQGNGAQDAATLAHRSGNRCTDGESRPAAAVSRVSMSAIADRPDRLAAVEEAFRTLPDRYLGADPGFDATYHVKLRDLGHTWEVRCTSHGARVRKGATAPLARRDDLHRRGHLAGAAPGRDVRDRRVRAAPAQRARQPRLRGRLRGDVPAARRPSAAAADPRRARRPPPHLHADHGPRSRRAAAARARRHAGLAVRHRGGAEPALPRARA